MTRELLGQKFGKLKVISYHGSKGRYRYWNCLCDCGNEKVVAQNSLVHGRDGKSFTTSCGCMHGAHLKDREPKDITGQKFNMLTALSFDHVETREQKNRDYERKVYFWRFRCDCGKEIITQRTYVIGGAKISCGCTRKNNKV